MEMNTNTTGFGEGDVRVSGKVGSNVTDAEAESNSVLALGSGMATDAIQSKGIPLGTINSAGIPSGDLNTPRIEFGSIFHHRLDNVTKEGFYVLVSGSALSMSIICLLFSYILDHPHLWVSSVFCIVVIVAGILFISLVNDSNSKSFYIKLVSFCTLITGIISVVFANIVDQPNLWLFLVFYVVVTVAGSLYIGLVNNSSIKGFYIRLVSCFALIMGIVSVVFTNILAYPCLCAFLVFYNVVILAGLLYCSISELRENERLRQRKSGILRKAFDLMEAMRRLYEELVGSYSQSKVNEIQAIVDNMKQCYNKYSNEYESTRNKIQLSKDDLALKQEMIIFKKICEEFENTLNEKKRKITELAEEEQRRIAVGDIVKRTDAIRDRLQQLEKTCKAEGYSVLVALCETMSIELNDFYERTVRIFNEQRGEVFRIKLGNDVNLQLKESSAKLDDVSKMLTQKGDVKKYLKDATDRVEQPYLDLKLIVDRIDDKDLSSEELKTSLLEIKKTLVGTQATFQTKVKDINVDMIAVVDSKKYTTLYSKICEVCCKYSSELEAIKQRIDKIWSAKPEGKLARDMKKLASKSGSVNDLNIFKLPVVLRHEDTNHSFRHYCVGEYDKSNCTPLKVIMMVGMTGAGKSLMINSIVNYFYGVNFQDNFRLQLIVQKDEHGGTGHPSTSLAENITQWVTSYTLQHKTGSPVPYSLLLIDIPGFEKDMKSRSSNEKIVKSIGEFFKNQRYPIDELSSIGLVIPASQASLTDEQTEVFDAVVNIFGGDVKRNICFMFTFADAQPPQALNTIKEDTKKMIEVFKFNNSALYASIDDKLNAYYWIISVERMKKFFNHIGALIPARVGLTLTKDFEKERQRLHILIEKLQHQINDKFESLQSIKGMEQKVHLLKGKTEDHKDVKIKKTVHVQTTQVTKHNVTNCVPCMFTCHNPCGIEGDVKEGCSAMQYGKCKNCPGKCPWQQHANARRIYVYTAVESEETIEDMVHRYNITIDDESTNEELIKKLEDDYRSQKESLFADIQSAYDAAKGLEEISLGKSDLTSLVYIQRLIESERSSNRPNSEMRIDLLIDFKKRASLHGTMPESIPETTV